MSNMTAPLTGAKQPRKQHNTIKGRAKQAGGEQCERIKYIAKQGGCKPVHASEKVRCSAPRLVILQCRDGKRVILCPQIVAKCSFCLESIDMGIKHLPTTVLKRR